MGFPKSHVRRSLQGASNHHLKNVLVDCDELGLDRLACEVESVLIGRYGVRIEERIPVPIDLLRDVLEFARDDPALDSEPEPRPMGQAVDELLEILDQWEGED